MESVTSWVTSQTTSAGRSPAVLNQLLYLQERCSLFEHCTVTLLLPTENGNAVIELNNHLRISLVTLCEIINVEDLRSLIRYVGGLQSPPTEPLNWKNSAAEHLINEKLKLKMEFERTEAVNSLTKEDNLPPKIRDLLTTGLKHLKPYERDRLFTITQDLVKMNSVLRQPVKDMALQFAALMTPEQISEFAACIEYAIAVVYEEAVIVKEEYQQKRKAISKKEASIFSLFLFPSILLSILYILYVL